MNKQSTALAAENIILTLNSRAGRVEILKSVTLAVATGESVGVVGRSGSGKSSLLSVLAGLERPTSGDVIAVGNRLSAMDEDALAKFRLHNIGFVFQAFHLIPTMTAFENASLPLELAGTDDATGRARDMLVTVGLESRLDHYPDQLSGGEQQRVAMVRALVGKPPILLADEPTGNLDRGSAQQVTDMLFELCLKAGSALILVTHDTALAARCDRVVSMEDGSLFDAEIARAAE